MQNRNVVPRGRQRAVPPQGRDAARTIEFDCSAVANLLDQQTPKPPPDLDAEIEVVAVTEAHASRASKDRFAHTLKRQGQALAVEGSRPMLPLAAPPITEEELDDETDTQEDLGPAAVTRAMRVVDESAFEMPVPAPAAPRRGSWLMPLSIALVCASAVGVLAALI